MRVKQILRPRAKSRGAFHYAGRWIKQGTTDRAGSFKAMRRLPATSNALHYAMGQSGWIPIARSAALCEQVRQRKPKQSYHDRRSNYDIRSVGIHCRCPDLANPALSGAKSSFLRSASENLKAQRKATNAEWKRANKVLLHDKPSQDRARNAMLLGRLYPPQNQSALTGAKNGKPAKVKLRPN